MEVFDFLVIAVIVGGMVKIISRWLYAQGGVSQRHINELEQRLQVLETQKIQELQKRLSVLEEIFVTEDITLQSKLRHALGSDSLTPPPAATRPPEHA